MHHGLAYRYLWKCFLSCFVLVYMFDMFLTDTRYAFKKDMTGLHE